MGRKREMDRRCVVIGDIHGCSEELALLLEAVSYQQGKDRLILLGDLIDRGPDPAGTVKLAREIGAECIMGNHEEKALRWRRHEKIKALWEANNSIHPYINPMRAIHPDRLAQWAAIPDKDWDWIETWPCYIHINDAWTAVHAGCFPGVDVERQKTNDLMRIRYIDPVRMKVVAPTKKGEKPDNCVFWTSLWKGPRRIIYGHETYKNIVVTEGENLTPIGPLKITDGIATIGIDTGGVYGGLLTAFIIYDPPQKLGANSNFEYCTKTIQINAKKQYVENKAWDEE